MRARLMRAANQLRESYWFVPAMMAMASILLACAMVWLDGHFGSGWMDGLPWLYAARPDGARSLLSAVGGSMIGVAGTTFSITIAAVVYASGQYGPRLLSNFMADRGNQITLGTFIATFLYALIVLRTIRSPGESGTGADAFVPQLALLVGVLLVLGSIGVLIFFIHHVPQRIHINNVIETIGKRLIAEIDHRFPVFVGAPLAEPDDEARVPAALRIGAPPTGERRAIRCETIGYIQVIDDAALIETARDHDLIVRMQYQPGDFARPGSVLLHVWPAARCDDGAAARLRGTFALGAKRTALQDMRFPADELVEIAARALSPGVNDPFTARSCLDWLGAAIADLARRELPSRLRADEEGALRLIAYPATFAGLVERSLGALAQYAAGDALAANHFVAVLGDVALSCGDPARLTVLERQLDDLVELASASLDGPCLAGVRQRADALRAALRAPERLAVLRDRPDWLAGTA